MFRGITSLRIRALSASFSTSSAAHSRRQVLVQLTANVEGLGFTGDRVLVSPGRARNQLIPARQAAFVPWKRASEKEERVTMRTEPEPPISSSSSSTSRSAPTPTPELLSALASLPAYLTFPHATTSATSSAIHGSVTLADVVKRLQEAHGVQGADVQVGWIGREDSERIKELGVWDVDVRPRGAEQGVQVGVEVTRA